MSPISAPAEARYARNLRLFTWFRILFNARYYYPVFTILYLDYGLTLEQFAILNVVWALTIVIAEVPSGALADILGRKPLLVLAAALMFIEMGLLVWVPLGSALLFPIFLLNRVCSGLAEAAASGADEALAYDSLKALAREGEWSSLLERTAKALSLAFFFTMITGALVYDPTVIHSLQATLGIETLLPESLIVRLPVILTWIHATALLVVVLSFKEPLVSRPQTLRRSIRQQLALPFHQIKEAARWTLGHRFVLFVIIAALAIDSVARQFVVLASEYYRVVEIPTALFGLIGAAISLMGMLTAKLSKHLVHHRSPISNLFFLSVALVIGLSGVSLTLPLRLAGLCHDGHGTVPLQLLSESRSRLRLSGHRFELPRPRAQSWTRRRQPPLHRLDRPPQRTSLPICRSASHRQCLQPLAHRFSAVLPFPARPHSTSRASPDSAQTPPLQRSRAMSRARAYWFRK